MNFPPWITPLLLALAIPLVIGTTVAPGSGTAKLSGRSASGKTFFTANLQDIEGMFEGGSLTVEGHTVEFPAANDGVEHHAIWDAKNGVFTLSYMKPGMEEYRFFRLWALPSTFKIISSDRGAGALYTFDAVLEATEPRPKKGVTIGPIQLSCRLEYRI
jgi:hypothetical protein